MNKNIHRRSLTTHHSSLAARGFTLVELLVVISIIGILMSLLLPAINSVREQARQTQCRSHIRQLALACLAHEGTNTTLPAGGWGWGWAGDPDFGVGQSQCGGWIYTILPQLGQTNLWMAGGTAGRLYRDLLDHVCRDHEAHVAPSSMMRLMRRIGCSLANAERERIFAVLRGRHVHLWREGDGYSILMPGHDPAVAAALRQLKDAEAGCAAHVDLTLAETTEGQLLTARGDKAFLFAQLFLALEAAAA